MTSVNVDIKPEILNWVIQRIQFENVASSALEQLNQWRAGEKIPTFHQIENVSKKTNIPFGYFFLDKPPIESFPLADFRTIGSREVEAPSRNLVDTMDKMSDVQSWMTEYVKEMGQGELSYVGRFDESANKYDMAKDIRKTLDIPVLWMFDRINARDAYNFLRSRIESIGILVMANGVVGGNTKRKLNVEEFRAFTLVNRYAPLIFINSCDTENGKLFSILHELAHVWIGEDSLYNEQPFGTAGNKRVEQICNAVAGEMLAPDDEFINQWNRLSGEISDKIRTVAQRFQCSRVVIARKALDNGLIAKDEYGKEVATIEKQYDYLKEKNNKGASGGDYYKTLNSRLDSNFVIALERSAKEGRTPYTEIYKLTGTNRKTFAKLIEDVGGDKRWR